MPGCMLYYNHKEKRKEVKKMKREQYYKNKRTGERNKQAMEWYRGKDEIEVWYFSETLGEWLCGVEWVW